MKLEKKSQAETAVDAAVEIVQLRAIRDELIWALEKCIDFYDGYCVEKIRAIIAKAKGGTS